MFKIALVILVAAPVIGLGVLLYSFSGKYVKKLNRRDRQASRSDEPEYSFGRGVESVHAVRDYRRSDYGRTTYGGSYGGGSRDTEYHGIGTGLDDFYK